MNGVKPSVAPEETIARLLPGLRATARLSQRQLAARANEYLEPDQKMPAQAIHEIEGGDPPRRVRVNEWLALAMALDVAPIYLVTGTTDRVSTYGTIHLGPLLVRVFKLREWIRGEDTLHGVDPERYFVANVPAWLKQWREREARKLPKKWPVEHADRGVRYLATKRLLREGE